MPVYQLTDGLVWQRGNHRVRFGFDWEHATSSGQFINQEPATIQLYSLRQVQQFNATAPVRSTLRESIDYNRFNRRPQGPLIPVCTAAQRNDVTAMCSNGSITLATPPESHSTRGCWCAWKSASRAEHSC